MKKNAIQIGVGILLVAGLVLGLNWFNHNNMVGSTHPPSIVKESSRNQEIESRFAAVEQQLESIKALLEKKQPPGTSTLEKRLINVEKRLETLLEQQESTGGQGSKATTTAVSPDEAPWPPTPGKFYNLDKSDQSALDNRYRIEELFAAEPVDSNWSVTATAKVEEVLVESPSGGKGATVECRENTCRVVVSHQTRRELDTFVQNLAARLHKDMPSVLVFNERGVNGSVSSELYLKRPTSK